jgi:multidrug efflux pump subunit AcrA (membrane-fusion protein)
MDNAHFLHRPIAFHTPDRAVDPPSWLGHTPFAFWIVDALRPATFIELGCHSGNSYSSVAQAVQTLNLSTACYAVDTWLGDPHSGSFDESVFAEWSEYHDRRFASFSRLVRSTFDEALDYFRDGTIDLLHIDGYHTFDAVSHDFETWRPKMSDRGVVLCHDINVREKDFGAWRLWERVAREYPSFEFRHGHGLGVLGIGNELPEALKWLLGTAGDDANAVRLFFARLGAAVVAEYTAASAQRAEASAREAAATAQRAAADALAGAAEAQATAADAQQMLATTLAARDERLEQATGDLDILRSDCTRLSDALASAEQALSARSAERDALLLEQHELRHRLASAEQAVTAHVEEVEQLASQLEARERRRMHPTIVVVSHVGGWRPRAGNQYRLHRMWHWYRRQGYRLIPVIAPLQGEELSAEAMTGTAETFGNVIQVHRDGRVEHDLRDVPDDFDPVPDSLALPSATFDDRAASMPRGRELLTMDTTFCHDAVIATVLQLQRSLGPHVLQVEYIWMTRLLPLVRADVLKVIDTHDVFSTIEQKVRMFGVRDLVVDRRDEAERLRRADLIIAIQDEERAELERLAPVVPVITAGVDFDVVDDPGGACAGRVLFIASGNPRNCKGLADFLRLAWPRIRRRVPGAEFVVAGGVTEALTGRTGAGVTVVGAVEEVSPLYRAAALVINPVVAGTGAKIKTIEALCHLRPVVTFPAGVDGLHPRLAAGCVVTRDWFEFSNAVVEGLARRTADSVAATSQGVIAGLVSAETTYDALDNAYRTFFERYRQAPVATVTSELGFVPTAGAHAD